MKLLILHGWGQSAENWKIIKNKLEDFVEIEIFNFPGFDGKNIPPKTWGVEEYADWVLNEINKRNLGDLIILGHSFGGRIAGYIA